MYMVFWVESHHTDSLAPALVKEPQCKEFPTSEMTAALKYCEELRTRRRNGAPISFVTLVSEHPDMVGEAGASAVVDGKLPDGSDYTWKKRRP